MKNINVKEALLLATFIGTILFMSSCSNTQKPEDNQDVAKNQNEEKFDNNDQQKDARFLVNAAEMNMEEIQLGRLAQQNGNTKQVKDLGKMMEVAHTISLTDLTALAQSKNITIPTSSTENAQDAYKKMSEKTGRDFDQAYSNKMVSGHKDAIGNFEKASADSYDSDIKNWATASLPDLRTHLTHSVETQKQFADMYVQKNN